MNVTHILRGEFDQAPLIVTKTRDGDYLFNNAIGTRLVQIPTKKGNMVMVTTNGYRKINVYSAEELWFAASNGMRAVKVNPKPIKKGVLGGMMISHEGTVSEVSADMVKELIGKSYLPDELRFTKLDKGTLITVRPTHNHNRATSMSTTSALVHR